MNKRTKLQKGMRRDVDIVAARGKRVAIEAKKSGPAREKTQITVRIDKDLINAVYAHSKKDNTRITDWVERGLQLALGEVRHDLSQYTSQIRFVLANTNKEQQKFFRGAAVRMTETEIDGFRRSAEGELLFWVCKQYMESGSDEPHADDALQVYARYGRSAEEIARLA